MGVMADRKKSPRLDKEREVSRYFRPGNLSVFFTFDPQNKTHKKITNQTHFSQRTKNLKQCERNRGMANGQTLRPENCNLQIHSQK